MNAAGCEKRKLGNEPFAKFKFKNEHYNPNRNDSSRRLAEFTTEECAGF